MIWDRVTIIGSILVALPFVALTLILWWNL